ncbi:hypothetical protein [Streptomyces phaeochromogenes]
MSSVDPQSVVKPFVYAWLPWATYPRELPPELAPWYCDAGHCTAVVVPSQTAKEIDPARSLALPVRTVRRWAGARAMGWSATFRTARAVPVALRTTTRSSMGLRDEI